MKPFEQSLPPLDFRVRLPGRVEGAPQGRGDSVLARRIIDPDGLTVAGRRVRLVMEA